MISLRSYLCSPIASDRSKPETISALVTIPIAADSIEMMRAGNSFCQVLRDATQEVLTLIIQARLSLYWKDSYGSDQKIKAIKEVSVKKSSGDKLENRRLE